MLQKASGQGRRFLPMAVPSGDGAKCHRLQELQQASLVTSPVPLKRH